MKKAWVLSYPLIAQRRLWSDWADAQADRSLRWAHRYFFLLVLSWGGSYFSQRTFNVGIYIMFDKTQRLKFHLYQAKVKSECTEYPNNHMFPWFCHWFLTSWKVLSNPRIGKKTNIGRRSILTSKRNASSKTLHNLLHEHHTWAKVWSILIFVCVSLNILKIWFNLYFFLNLGGPCHIPTVPPPRPPPPGKTAMLFRY